jgi:hypothetical protein
MNGWKLCDASNGALCGTCGERGWRVWRYFAELTSTKSACEDCAAKA